MKLFSKIYSKIYKKAYKLTDIYNDQNTLVTFLNMCNLCGYAHFCGPGLLILLALINH